MIILDENILKSQRLLLTGWRIHAHQIGFDIAQRGISDEDIIPLLLCCRRPTFFTRDEDFYDRLLCHPRYCLVFLDVAKTEAAFFARRLLRQPDLKTQAKRMGKVVRVSSAGIRMWRRHVQKETHLKWKD